ncbi:MAG: HEAT repeat domain-containing protein [Desulfobacterales bacterium]|nr:HEAT repeat domain-containing protein [Desulfobacterales bacterium]
MKSTLKQDKNDAIRSRAANILGKIGDPSIEPLIKALERGNQDVRHAAAEALVLIGPHAVQPLLWKHWDP